MRLLALAIVAVPSVALACMHAGGGPTTTPVTQSGQQGIVVHAGGVQDLILQVDYTGLSTQSLGWIVPVPSTPTDYGVGDTQLFRDVAEWVNLRRQMPQPRGRLRGRPSASAQAPTLRFGEPARVGPYNIQPIVGFGAGAATALNRWMEENGFQPLPAQTLSYYVQRNWTFLAIKATPQEGAELSAEGGMPPLRITFPSERAVYPLKLSTHMGTFPVRIYLFTAEPVRAEALESVRAKGFEVATGGIHLRHAASMPGTLRSDVSSFAVNTAPEALRPVLERLGTQAHLSVLLNETFNREGGNVEMRAAHWAEDLSVPGVGEGEVLAGQSAEADPEPEPDPEAEADPEPEAEAAMSEDPTPASESDEGGCSASGSPHFAGAFCLLLLWGRKSKTFGEVPRTSTRTRSVRTRRGDPFAALPQRGEVLVKTSQERKRRHRSYLD